MSTISIIKEKINDYKYLGLNLELTVIKTIISNLIKKDNKTILLLLIIHVKK